ncbi:3-oxoadipate enol-lactonase [Murinocardiopsis flavida]|uniref:3-oxoadipate enol-lactonase n=1 Tax=Murinocardiopsis flavida TaxID=645275 RepID=A0A2P8DQH6_9ACTN|nr:alpha/beta hydrolase [Murinocardiopsis flavida]PSK99479.1 3-oxoadipate enol-lactonase [Murinocardiopsis flavida]
MTVVPLQYRFDGPRHAPVAVLLPTIGTRWSVWEPQMPELTRGARVLRVDLRGHGKSPAPAGRYAADDLAADLFALFDRAGVDRYSLVGLGFGAMLASRVAAMEPRRVRRVALLAGTARVSQVRRVRRIAAAARAEGTAAVAPEATLPWFTPDFRDRRPDVVARFVREFGETDPGGFAALCETAAGLDQRRLLARVPGPVLVVSAAHDPFLPPGHGRRLAAALPRARFEVVAGAAHLLTVERAARVNDLLVRYLPV